MDSINEDEKILVIGITVFLACNKIGIMIDLTFNTPSKANNGTSTSCKVD